MAATNTDSPVLDGIWFRPALVKPDDATPVTIGINSIPAGAKVAVVSAVTNNANDWITLPAVAEVPNGHEIIILCSAGGNFELRTPASSDTKINDVDSDGTQEYLCTDKDIVRVVKVSNTQGWIAQSLDYLGAVRTAVVPD